MSPDARQLALFPPTPIGPAAVSGRVERTARSLPANVHLGTSSWSFPGWAGIVYDRRTSSSDLARSGLAAYSRHPLLRVAGVDRTYYEPLSVEDFRRYAREVPPAFRFLVKAHCHCTLPRLSPTAGAGVTRPEPNPRFLDAGYATREVIDPLRRGLAERAGPVVFQFSPGDGVQGFAERLHTFLSALPRGPLYAVEIRNRHWLTPEYAAALRETGASPCLAVHPSMPDVDAQVRVLGRPEAWPALVVRWMLGAGRSYEDSRARYAPFDRIVDPDPATRLRLATLCAKAVRSGRAAYVTVNNKAEGSAPLSVGALADEIVAIAGEA